MGLSRRSFLKGTLAVGAAAGVAAVTEGIIPMVLAESEPEKEVSELDSTKKPGTWDAAKAPIPPVGAPLSWDQEADVIIVGSGGGGITAAYRLSKEGKSVILIERESIIGGETRFSVYWFNNGGTDIAEKMQWAFPEYPYNPDKIVEYFNYRYGMTANTKLLRKMVDAGPKVIKWVQDEFGAKFQACPIFAGAPSAAHTLWFDTNAQPEILDYGFKNGFDWLMDKIVEKAESYHTDIKLKTEVTALVMDHDRIIGVRALSNGEERYYRAKEAVVLTAGSFANNRPMLGEYCPTSAPALMVNAGWTGATGECVRMGLGVGADMTGRDSVASYDRGVLKHEYTDDELTLNSYREGDQVICGHPWLMINRMGERVPFPNTTYNEYPYANMGMPPMLNGWMGRVNNFIAQPGGKTFVVFDKNYREILASNTFGDLPAPGLIFDDFCHPTPVDALCDKIESTFVEDGTLKKAYSLEDLEKQLGLERGILTEAVKKWNAACEAGEDHVAYYKYEPAWLKPVVEAPFYGAIVGGISYDVNCGLLVNDNMQVISTKGSPIEGLYAGFHTAGGSSGTCTLGGLPFMSMYGTSLLSFVGGWMAADGILGETEI